MSNNNIFNNTTNLQEVLEILQNKAAGGGSGGVDTSDATATKNDILSGKTAYTADGKVTGTIPTRTESDLTASAATVTVPAGHYASQSTKTIASGSATTPSTTITKNPTISVSSTGLITASVSGTQNITPTVTAGYISNGTAGTVTVNGSNTKQLTTKAATTYTPTTTNQTIASGTYLTGTQTIKGDSNLVANNIKKGVSIFGVTGTHVCDSGIDTSDATAAAAEIFEGKTAYVADQKVTGTFTIESELTEQNSLISQIVQLVNTKANPSGGSTQTCVATLTTGGPSAYGAYNVYYMDANGILQTEACGDFEFGIVINPAVNSIVVVSGATSIQVEGACTRLSDDACFCTGTCDIWVDY